MEVKKTRDWGTFPKLREAKNPAEASEPGTVRREEGFRMIKGGKGYTIADIEALPEGERAELIDGEMFRMDTPTWTHQEMQMALSAKIWNFIVEHKGTCRVIPAPFAVYIKKDKRNYVEPDISVICDEEKKSEKGCQGAPDWVIEIVSPFSVKMDYERKVKLYREAGVREYWIVDAEKQTVTVYDFEHSRAPLQTDMCTGGTCAVAMEQWDEPVPYAFSERIKAGVFEDLYLKILEMGI